MEHDDPFSYADDVGALATGPARRRGAPGRSSVTARMPASATSIARAVARQLARHGDGGVAEDAETLVARAGGGGGSALPAALRTQFEASLGVDLGGVRVHDDSAAASAAAAVGARAYATGQDVFFAAGEHRPGTTEGAHLLAHEVAHTVQQRGGGGERRHKLAVTTPGDAIEAEADRAADAMMFGRAFAIGAGPEAVARVVDPATEERSCTAQSQALEQVRAITTISMLREAHARLAGQARGDGDAMVVAEVSSSSPMLRRHLWSVITAAERRLSELEGQTVPAPASGPAAHHGPGSFPGANGSAIGPTSTAGVPAAIHRDREAAAESVAAVRHASHGSIVPSIMSDVAHPAHAAEVLTSAAEVAGPRAARAVAGLGVGASAVGGGLLALVGEVVLMEVLFRSIEWSLRHTYDQFEFPAYVNAQVGPGITANAHRFVVEVVAALRGQTAGPEATRLAQAHVAQLRASHPEMTVEAIHANARDTALEATVFDSLAPGFRGAVDHRAAEIVREHRRPGPELDVLVRYLRQRVESAR